MNFFSWLDFRVFIFLLGRIRKQNKLKAKDAAVANISSLCVKKVTASFKILEEGFMWNMVKVFEIGPQQDNLVNNAEDIIFRFLTLQFAIFAIFFSIR